MVPTPVLPAPSPSVITSAPAVVDEDVTVTLPASTAAMTRFCLVMTSGDSVYVPGLIEIVSPSAAAVCASPIVLQVPAAQPAGAAASTVMVAADAVPATPKVPTHAAVAMRNRVDMVRTLPLLENPAAGELLRCSADDFPGGRPRQRLRERHRLGNLERRQARSTMLPQALLGRGGALA